MARLRESGLCETCDLIRTAGEPLFGEATPVAETEKDVIPRKRRAYWRRAPGEALRRPGRPPKQPSYDESLLGLERLRSQYSEEHAGLGRQMKALEIKLEALDEVEKEIRSALK